MSRKPYEHLAASLWILFAERELILGKTIELLRQIESKGSLSRAAKEVPMSYKSAWDLIDKINNVSAQPVVVTVTGGRNGGGTQLSDYGRLWLTLYTSLERTYENAFSEFNNVKIDADLFLNIAKGICMKTSARNQLSGKVKKVTKGMVNSEILVDIGNSVTVNAVITNDSTTELDLKPDDEVIILVKASAIILFPGDNPVKSSCENMLLGRVREVRPGIVNAEVLLDLSGGKVMTAVVTKESITSLGIKDGMMLYGAFNAAQVILALPM